MKTPHKNTNQKFNETTATNQSWAMEEVLMRIRRTAAWPSSWNRLDVGELWWTRCWRRCVRATNTKTKEENHTFFFVCFVAKLVCRPSFEIDESEQIKHKARKQLGSTQHLRFSQILDIVNVDFVQVWGCHDSGFKKNSWRNGGLSNYWLGPLQVLPRILEHCWMEKAT
jgi:hypothetical protein